MFGSLLSLLSKDSTPIGTLLVLFICVSVWLGKALLHEKDKEITDKTNQNEKITLVLGEVNHTLEAILVDLRYHHGSGNGQDNSPDSQNV